MKHKTAQDKHRPIQQSEAQLSLGEGIFGSVLLFIHTHTSAHMQMDLNSLI